MIQQKNDGFFVHFEGQKHGLLNLEVGELVLNPEHENFKRSGMANNANFISISTSIIKKKFHENGININMLLLNSTILELISILPNYFSHEQ